jgi:hypothetical protein
MNVNLAQVFGCYVHAVMRINFFNTAFSTFDFIKVSFWHTQEPAMGIVSC